MLDRISGFIAKYKGVPVLLGVALVVANFVAVLLAPPGSWLVTTNLFLHLGVIVGLMGILLGDALGS